MYAVYGLCMYYMYALYVCSPSVYHVYALYVCIMGMLGMYCMYTLYAYNMSELYACIFKV